MNNFKYLYLNSRDELYRVEVKKIVYFEAEGNYTNFVLSNKLKGVVGMNLSGMQEILNSSLRERAAIFARVGKRFIINLNYVYHIETVKQKLTLSDGENFAYQLPVSKDALKKLKDIYIGNLVLKARSENKAKEEY